MRKYKTVKGILYGMLQVYKNAQWGRFHFYALHARQDAKDHCYCIGGAMQLVATGNSCGTITDGATEHLVIKALGFDTRGDMYNWNDRLALSKKDVVERIQSAYNKVNNNGA